MRPNPFQRLLGAAGAMLVAIPALASAQQATTISGRVVSDAGVPLQGASVSIPAMSVGGYSQADGRYSFTVPARYTGQVATLTARRIGYTPRSESVRLNGGTLSQDFALVTSPTQLTGVVVTALGVEREKSTLGTAQQQLSSAELTTTPTDNIVKAIEGKVSGVEIRGSGTQGGSSRIVIRGANSITGDNTPLFVVDGIPISKTNHGADANGGWDFGSTLNDLNPDDIETMSILKGPNAAALYGSQAANGAIIITTKRGRNSQGTVHTEFNGFYTFDRPSILPTYQNQYGQGAGGEFMYVDGQGDGVNDGADQSWGPRLDGRTHGCTFSAGTNTDDPMAVPASAYDQSAPCLQFTSPNAASPWIAHPNNVADFFNTGHDLSGTFAVSGGTDHANARLSMGSDQISGIIPNNFLHKNTAVLTGALQVGSRFSTNGTVQYIRDVGVNRPGQGYSNSILESFVWFGRQVDMNALKNGYQTSGAINNGPANREYNWNYNYHNNPFFLMYENPETDARDRLVGSVSGTYKLMDWLSLTGRTGADVYRYGINQNWTSADITGVNMDYSTAGAFSRVNDNVNNLNSDLILTATHDLTSRILFNGTAGGTIRTENFSEGTTYVKGITAPDIYNVSNAAIAPSLSQFDSHRQTNSLYGSAAFTWNGWWTVEGTARNDWSSTLPKGNNSYFYPSVNTSVVLTDAIPSLKNRVLSYVKLRASLAQVGNDANPYLLQMTYTGLPTYLRAHPQYTFTDVIANPALKPEITKSGEVGAEVSFINGRANLDATWYSKATRDQIFNVAVSPATGFGSKSINAGEITNKGIEALLTLIPVQADNGLQWTTTFNYSKNKSMVASLYPGVKTIVLGGTWYTNVEARQGQPYGTLFGYAFARDSATGQLLTDGGIPYTSGKAVLGNIQPSWVGGWSNQVTYKGLTLSALVDGHVGGDIFSVTNYFGEYSGVLKSSLKGREIDWNRPGYLVHGIDVNTGKANTDTVTAEQYYQNIFPVNEPYIYKDTYFKLRELRIGYDLPTRWSNKFNAAAVNVAITARNLYTWTKVPNIDPEFAFQTGNVQGIEYASIPSPRTWGLAFRITP